MTAVAILPARGQTSRVVAYFCAAPCGKECTPTVNCFVEPRFNPFTAAKVIVHNLQIVCPPKIDGRSSERAKSHNFVEAPRLASTCYRCCLLRSLPLLLLLLLLHARPLRRTLFVSSTPKEPTTP